MWGRFVRRLASRVTLLHVAVTVMFCLVLAASFALGALVERERPIASPPPVDRDLGQAAPQRVQPPGPRGTFGAIEDIHGDVIRVRDPRDGRTWSVHARNDTVIEFGPRRRIPFDNLRVGQRIFVVGVPDEGETPNGFDAQFIGVVLGQPQKFMRPAQEPAVCWDCTD